jgi:transcriptional regulator with XRE-family HTH domain
VKILAALETFDELIAVMRDRRISLGLSQNALEDRAGLAGGYVGKLEGSRGKSNSRSIGRESLPLLLGALGLELAVVDGAMRAVAAHGPEDDAGQSVAVLRGENYMRALGKLGANKTNARLTGKERSANARKAAKARWKRYREEKRKG